MAEASGGDESRAVEPPPLRTWEDLVNAVDTLLAVLDMRLVADTRAAVQRTWQQLAVTDEELDQVFRSQTEDVARRSVEAAWVTPSRQREMLPTAGVAGEGRSDLWRAHSPGGAEDPEDASPAGSPSHPAPPAPSSPAPSPATGSPIETSPTTAPPIDSATIDEPPVEPPPVEPPPVDTPPVDTPPVDTPPVDTPPVDTPRPPDAVPPLPSASLSSAARATATDRGSGTSLLSTPTSSEESPPLPRRTPGASRTDGM